jgi:hypothetical protein
MITIKQIQDKCVQVFGLEHPNTRMIYSNPNNARYLWNIMYTVYISDVVHIICSLRHHNTNEIMQYNIVVEIENCSNLDIRQLYSKITKVLQQQYPYHQWDRLYVPIDNIIGSI